MVYRRIIVFQVVDAELHKAQGFSLTLPRCIWFSKPQQGRQQPADKVATTVCCFLIKIRECVHAEAFDGASVQLKILQEW